MTVALITGANSGIGRSSAVELAAKGWTVYGSMRHLDKGAKPAAEADAAGVTVHPVVCDVTDTASVNEPVATVTEHAGWIDVLVKHAGGGANGVLEVCSVDTYAEVMDVNLYGAIRCSQAVLPQMRERGAGMIINVSSICGVVAAMAQSPYVASKWALEGLSEGMAQELAPFGIRVAVIEPGIVRTAIMAKNTEAGNETGAYDAHNRRLFSFYAAGLRNPGLPREVGDVIYAAATDDPPRFRYTCGWGGSELVDARRRLDMAEWVALGAITDDDAYNARFQEMFGLDIS
ncbi:MAG: SDR family oxidoreductase [Acidimicrobiales bacterium]